MLVAEPLRPEVPAGLLVGDEHELQRAAGAPSLPGQGRPGHRLGRHLRLHVERPPPPQEAVGHLARPRIVLPL